MTNNEQLELGINGNQNATGGGRQADRKLRAAWWFSQMRRVVANAVDWQAAGPTQGQPNWPMDAQAK